MENKTINFVLKGISTDQFATFEENYSKEEEVNLNTNLEFKISRENKQVGVYTTFTFEQAKKAFLKIQVSCHFDIDADAWNGFLSEEKIVLPHSLMSHLTMLTIGTARGVLHSKTNGSEFNKYILPTLDVAKTLTKDVEFNLN